MGFKEYLSSTKNIEPGRIPYFLFWIDCYLQFKASYPNSEEKFFYRSLEDQYEPWQIQQARNAVLYLNSYKRMNQAENKVHKLNGKSVTDTWKVIYSKTQEELRLQHKSYKTEKAYLSWIKRKSRSPWFHFPYKPAR